MLFCNRAVRIMAKSAPFGGNRYMLLQRRLNRRRKLTGFITSAERIIFRRKMAGFRRKVIDLVDKIFIFADKR